MCKRSDYEEEKVYGMAGVLSSIMSNVVKPELESGDLSQEAVDIITRAMAEQFVDEKWEFVSKIKVDMTAEELFEKLYPEEEAGVERMLSKKFIVAFAEAYAQQLYDDNVQLKKQNKRLRKFVTKFHNWIFERDTERIYKMLDELKINAEQLLKPK